MVTRHSEGACISPFSVAPEPPEPLTATEGLLRVAAAASVSPVAAPRRFAGSSRLTAIVSVFVVFLLTPVFPQPVWRWGINSIFFSLVFLLTWLCFKFLVYIFFMYVLQWIQNTAINNLNFKVVRTSPVLFCGNKFKYIHFKSSLKKITFFAQIILIFFFYQHASRYFFTSAMTVSADY